MMKANPEWSWGPLPDDRFFVERVYKPRLRVTYRRGHMEGLEWLDPEPSSGLQSKYRQSATNIMKRRTAPAQDGVSGRPQPVGRYVIRTTALTEDEAASLDAWIAQQEPRPSLTAAIRQFVLAGLRAKSDN